MIVKFKFSCIKLCFVDWHDRTSLLPTQRA